MASERKFLATGRMTPGQAKAMRMRMELTRKRAGKKPKPKKPPAELGPQFRTLPIRERKPPRRIKKPAERIGAPKRIQ